MSVTGQRKANTFETRTLFTTGLFSRHTIRVRAMWRPGCHSQIRYRHPIPFLPNFNTFLRVLMEYSSYQRNVYTLSYIYQCHFGQTQLKLNLFSVLLSDFPSEFGFVRKHKIEYKAYCQFYFFNFHAFIYFLVVFQNRMNQYDDSISTSNSL